VARDALISARLDDTWPGRVHRIPRREYGLVERLLNSVWLRYHRDLHPLLQALRDVLGALLIFTCALFEARFLGLSLVSQEQAQVLGYGRELVQLDLLVDLVDELGVLGLQVGHRDAESIEGREFGRAEESSPLELLLLLSERFLLLDLESSRLNQLFTLNRHGGTDLIDHLVSGLHHIGLGDQVDQVGKDCTGLRSQDFYQEFQAEQGILLGTHILCFTLRLRRLYLQMQCNCFVKRLVLGPVWLIRIAY